MANAVKSKVFNKTTYVNKLIKALRSGKYQQIEGSLRDGDDRFCLWGVGAEVYRQEYNHCDWDDDGNIVVVPDDWQKQLWENPELCLDEIMEKEDAEIPHFIQKKIRSDGSIRVGKSAICTMDLNDDGITFEGLAALLEKYPLVQDSSNDRPMDSDDVTGALNRLFKGTKLEKTWRTKAIRPGSDYEETLMEEELALEEADEVYEDSD